MLTKAIRTPCLPMILFKALGTPVSRLICEVGRVGNRVPISRRPELRIAMGKRLTKSPRRSTCPDSGPGPFPPHQDASHMGTSPVPTSLWRMRTGSHCYRLPKPVVPACHTAQLRPFPPSAPGPRPVHPLPRGLPPDEAPSPWKPGLRRGGSALGKAGRKGSDHFRGRSAPVPRHFRLSHFQPYTCRRTTAPYARIAL